MKVRVSARRFAAVLLLATSFLSLVPPPAATAYHREQLNRTRRDLRAARARLASLVQTDRQLLGIIRDISGQLHDTQSSLAAARGRLASIQTRIRTQQRRLEVLDAAQDTRKNNIEQRARQLYMIGSEASMEAFLEARTFDELIGRTAMLSSIQQHDREAIEELRTLGDRATKAKKALESQRAFQVEVRDEIAERESIESELLETRVSARSQLNRRIDAFRAEVRALAAQEERIQALLRSVSSGGRGSVSTGPVSRAGFVWPISGRVTSPYGPRWGEFHTGIDIDCRTGDPLGASKAGTVIASEWGGGYGRMVIIDHGNGVSTLYAHMSQLWVSQGQRISQRQRVGACGETGRAYGDHLHFEVRVNGRHQNPRHYLP